MPLQNYLSPVGRIVQGNPLVSNTSIDDNTKKPKLNDDGTPKLSWYTNIAFSKQDPATIQMVADFYKEAANTFPQLFPQGYNPNMPFGGCVRPDFAIKLVDGDGMDLNGKPHANKEGWAGHWIVKVSSYIGAMRCYNGLQNNAPIDQPDQIHPGMYVRANLSVKGNGWTGQGNSKPGLFVNPEGIQLVGYGAKIINGPDANTMFAAPVAAGYTPPGMSTVPVASAAMPAQPGAAPQPGMTPAPQPQAAPAPVAMAPQPHAAPTYTMTQLAQGFTREQWNSNGQDDAWLIANGYMTVNQPAAAPAPAPQPQMPAPGIMGSQPQVAAPIVQQAPAPAPQPQLQVAPPNPAFTQSAINPTYTMTQLAQGFTREQWNSNGQDDAWLIANGYMLVA